MRKNYSFRFDYKIIEAAKKAAKKDNRSLTNYIETILSNNLKTIQS